MYMYVLSKWITVKLRIVMPSIIYVSEILLCHNITLYGSYISMLFYMIHKSWLYILCKCIKCKCIYFLIRLLRQTSTSHC